MSTQLRRMRMTRFEEALSWMGQLSGRAWGWLRTPRQETAGERATALPAVLCLGPLWPEFDNWLEQRRAIGDDGWLKLRHDAELRERAFDWWARQRGQSRGERLMAAEQRAARRLAGRLPAGDGRLLLPQPLLPYLWRDGTLRDRRFEVMLTRPPLAELARTWARCAAAHPGSLTASEYSIPPALCEAEAAALEAAERWLTPFPGLLDGGVDTRPHQLLPWCAARALPLLRPRRRLPRLLFPLATAASNGAFELRAALAGLPFELVTGGSELEGPRFWSPRPAARLNGRLDWRREVDLVVLPAWTSARPTLLLKARAAGIPVIATAACGLRPCTGVTQVAVGDVSDLQRALLQWLERRDQR